MSMCDNGVYLPEVLPPCLHTTKPPFSYHHPRSRLRCGQPVEMPMKSLFLMLIAALGITAGAATRSTSAHASDVHSDVHLHPPFENNGG